MNPNFLLDQQVSERLLFRKVMPNDFELWLPFHQDPRSSQYWEGLPTDPFIACKAQFDTIFERYEKELGGMNALIHKSTNAFIGMCGLMVQTVDHLEELEIGYSILPKFWKQGYATEAATRCIEHAIAYTLADSLISIIHVDNLPSQKVALKNGMVLDNTTTYRNNPVHIFRIVL